MLCFANETLMNRDREIYLRSLKEKLVYDKVHYTTEFDPDSEKEVGVIVHWIVDESDELVFGNPEDFY